MLSKKTPVSPSCPGTLIRKELEYLYSRRVAVESLIQSLEHYERFRPKRAVAEYRKFKTA
jgi:hypothetical protein